MEQDYACEPLSDGRGGVGYLLKDRVAEGGTVMDPEVVRQLLTRRAEDPLESLTSRELEVLALMAEGRGNGEIAELLFVTPNAVHKHIGNIFAKFGLAPTDSGHRRVCAVPAYLERR